MGETAASNVKWMRSEIIFFLKPRRDYQCELIRTQDTYDLLVNELEGYLGNRSLEHLQAVSFKAMCVKRIVYFYA